MNTQPLINFGAEYTRRLSLVDKPVAEAAHDLYASLLETHGPTEGQAIIAAVDRLFWADMPVPE